VSERIGKIDGVWTGGGDRGVHVIGMIAMVDETIAVEKNK
jgi:hypothetical protein